MKTARKQFACKLTSPELQQRKATVINELKALILTREELTNGLRLRFNVTNEILDKLNDFIKTERICCDFLRFQITVEENFCWLKISGPTGAKEFLQDEIGF